jgi:hypothetical protein
MKKSRNIAVIVGQGLRYAVGDILRAGGVKVFASGYTDSSTTLWGFRCLTTKTASEIQDLIWNTPGYGSICVTVRESAKKRR